MNNGIQDFMFKYDPSPNRKLDNKVLQISEFVFKLENNLKLLFIIFLYKLTLSFKWKTIDSSLNLKL